MIIDFSKAKEDLLYKEIENKIESYAQKLRVVHNQVDEILDDIELSEIDWFEASTNQKEKIEAISKIGMFMETYAAWAKD